MVLVLPFEHESLDLKQANINDCFDFEICVVIEVGRPHVGVIVER